MEQTSNRKDAHLELCLRGEVNSNLPTGFSRYALCYDALPELDWDDVDLTTSILGKRLSAPILVGAMTGGSKRAGELNARLARAAARVGIGMALGSQRAMIENPRLTATYALRDFAPSLPLLVGNIGAVQLNYGVTSGEIAKAVSAVRADAIYFHLNPLQEAIQPEGDRRWRGVTEKLANTMLELECPCLVKEVGAGLSARTLRKLAPLPMAGVEVSGVGGTSWSRIEALRARPESPSAVTGHHLAGFGVSTAESVVEARLHMGERLVIASGGIRTGQDIAIALALGADAVAMARPLLLAADRSEEAVVETLEQIIHELRVICFCTGSRNYRDLREALIDRERPSP